MFIPCDSPSIIDINQRSFIAVANQLLQMIPSFHGGSVPIWIQLVDDGTM
jgi:hypothetical protein